MRSQMRMKQKMTKICRDCSTKRFNKTKAAMNQCAVQLFPKEESLLYPCLKSQHIKSPHTRKRNSPYLNITAVCTFPSCSAKYLFKMKKEPVGESLCKISVLQRGKMAHAKSEKKFRPAANMRRGRIARALRKGVGQLFYSKLKKTPVVELISRYEMPF